MDTAKPPGARWLRAVLVSVFVLVSLRLVLPPLIVGLPFGWDAVVYAEAARAVLSGGDPWSSQGYAITFAAPPPSLVPFLPFAWMPDALVSVVWIGLNAASAVYVIRKLGLPWYYLAFPPIVLSTIAGSTALPVTALMVAGLGALGIFGRLYAALPYLIRGEWRPLLIGGVLIALTLPLWPSYLASDASETLAAQSEGLSALSVPWTVPFAVLGLVLLGRERAAWLIVPALWPDTQLYYAVIALPVLARMRLVALSLAIPIPGLVVVGMLAQWAVTRARGPGGWSWWRTARRTSVGPAPRP
jgi:hypothetical protein